MVAARVIWVLPTEIANELLHNMFLQRLVVNFSLFDILARMLSVVDQIVRSRRRTIAIIVQRDGKVIVRAPLKAPERLIRGFVESKKDWIKEKISQAHLKQTLPVKQFVDGERFWLLGSQHSLRLVEDQRPALILQTEFTLSKIYQARALQVFEKWYRAQALKILTDRTALFSARYGYQYQKLRITAARTRWGSCSSRGTLSFTWRLVMAPLEVIDYVVIHELVHLKIQNHSSLFWQQVACLMPDYQQHRDWLKKNGHFLTLDGGE